MEKIDQETYQVGLEYFAAMQKWTALSIQNRKTLRHFVDFAESLAEEETEGHRLAQDLLKFYVSNQEPATVPAPEFKAGDRVRHLQLRWCGTITRVSGLNCADCFCIWDKSSDLPVYVHSSHMAKL